MVTVLAETHARKGLKRWAAELAFARVVRTADLRHPVPAVESLYASSPARPWVSFDTTHPHIQDELAHKALKEWDARPLVAAWLAPGDRASGNSREVILESISRLRRALMGYPYRGFNAISPCDHMTLLAVVGE